MEVNSEKIYVLKGISLKRVMRMNCPRGLRSNSSHLSPLLICIGLAACIITNSIITNHSRINGNEHPLHTTSGVSVTSVDSVTTSTTKLLTTKTVIDNNIKVAEIILPYDWVRDDFFSPHKGKVITKNERKYKPKNPLRFDNVKSESKNLENKFSILKKDTENTINKNIDEKSSDFVDDNLKTQVVPNGVLKSLIGPNGILQSFSKGETGSNPGGGLLGLVAAGVKQWQEATTGNNQVNKKHQINDNISSNAVDATFLNKSSSFEGKHISSNYENTEVPIIQRGNNKQGRGDISVRDNHNKENPIGPVLSNIAPLASVFMKQIVKPSDSHHKPPSLAKSLMENIGPVLIQNAIGRLANPTYNGGNGPISPVESLVRNLGPAVLQGVMNGAGRGEQEHGGKPISPVESLVRNIGPSLIQGVMNGAGRGEQGHWGKPISPVDSLVRNIGSSLLQGVMNGAVRGEQERPSGFMSIISKAAPKLLNGLLTGGKARHRYMKKSNPEPRHLSKRVAFADTPQQGIK